MELSRQEYPTLLVCRDSLDVTYSRRAIEFELSLTFAQTTLQPDQAVSVLNDRVKLIGKVNSDIADWLHVCKSMCFAGNCPAYSYTRSGGALRTSMSRVSENLPVDDNRMEPQALGMACP